MSLKIGNYLKFFIKPCVMAVHLPLHGYISIYFTNAHGRNGQLIKSYVTETSSPPPPASSSGSRPFCSCDRRQGKGPESQQTEQGSRRAWGVENGGWRLDRGRGAGAQALTASAVGRSLSAHLGPRLPLKMMESHSEKLLDTHYNGYF